ncbi:hypothetical protein GCM10011297_11900 [Bacterioplanes sanyensis]|nr:hypothetical protein GCM10011297_11900 [Bacterioplanes sanyensis]
MIGSLRLMKQDGFSINNIAAIKTGCFNAAAGGEVVSPHLSKLKLKQDHEVDYEHNGRC